MYLRYDGGIQFRVRENENIEKKVNEIKNKINHQPPLNNETTLFNFLTTKHRRSLYIGLFTFFTGSLLLYKYVSNNNRNH